MNMSFLYYWLVFWSLLLGACTPTEAPADPPASRSVIAQPALGVAAQPAPVAHLTADSLATTTPPVTEASFDPLELYTAVAYWRSIEQSATGFSTESLLPLRVFAGDKVSETVALLLPLAPDTVKLYVDYFEGDLVGSKVFYASSDGLLAVDVHEMNMRDTESGRAVQSVLTHTFCYHGKHMVHHVQHHEAAPSDSDALARENLSDWAVIHAELQLL